MLRAPAIYHHCAGREIRQAVAEVCTRVGEVKMVCFAMLILADVCVIA